MPGRRGRPLGPDPGPAGPRSTPEADLARPRETSFLLSSLTLSEGQPCRVGRVASVPENNPT